jgi:hypothetical protein
MYTGATVPFPNAIERKKHYRKHGWKFGARDEHDYERMADEFMSAPMHADLYEDTMLRQNGVLDRLRLHGVTLHFGVAHHISILRSFYPRKPHEITRHGGPAGFIAAKCKEVR